MLVLISIFYFIFAHGIDPPYYTICPNKNDQINATNIGPCSFQLVLNNSCCFNDNKLNSYTKCCYKYNSYNKVEKCCGVEDIDVLYVLIAFLFIIIVSVIIYMIACLWRNYCSY